jgi:hypothetical protein
MIGICFIIHHPVTQNNTERRCCLIKVYQAEKIDGVNKKKIEVRYNCVGSIEIPNILPLPQPEVLIQTRKGVAISYS